MPRPTKAESFNKQEIEAANSPNLTPEERAIAQRVANQDTDWHVIREDELNDYSLSKDRYELPEKAQKLQQDKVYAFRWVERTPDNIDTHTRTAPLHRRWTLVTRSTIPQLEKEVDGILGCVCRGDQCLVYRPWFYHENEKRMKQALAEANYEAGSLKGRKDRIEDRDNDVKVTVGERAAIGGSDEVMWEETGADLGDLVAE